MYDYGRFSYLNEVDIPDFEDEQMDGSTLVYRVEPFHQVIMLTFDRDGEKINSTLVGVFGGLAKDGTIMIRDGAPCSRSVLS